MFHADFPPADKRHWGLALIAIVALALPLALAGCASKSDKGEDDLNPDVAEMPVEEIYNAAYKYLDNGRYEEAAKGFDEVERQHPYSVWARRAMLMSAFAYYQANKYDDAIDSADRFLSLHPGNRDAPYAYYLKAICYYEQISDVGRDQEKTLQALNALQEIVRRYPDSEYARDAHLKIDLTRDHLAGKEMYIGRYYLNHAQYVAAINRFKSVVETYQTTSHVPEALERMTEAYFALGLNDEAQASAAVLGYNFPDSQWYKYGYDLLTQHGMNSGAAKPQQASVRQVEAPNAAAGRAIAPPVDAGAVEGPKMRPSEPSATDPGLVATPQTSASVSAPLPGASPTPPGAPPAPQGTLPPDMAPVASIQSQPQAEVPAEEKPLRTVPAIDRPYTDEDLKDSWVRRLVRGIF